MGKPPEKDCESLFDMFETICDVKGHLFIEPEKDIIPKELGDPLFKFCFVCDDYIKFWHYSCEMIDLKTPSSHYQLYQIIDHSNEFRYETLLTL